MPYRCVNCEYKQDEYQEECPKCGGYLEEIDPVVDWEGEGVIAEEEREEKRDKNADHPHDGGEII